jgi:hypothetical protein
MGHIPSGLVYRRMVSLLDVVPTAVAAAQRRRPEPYLTYQLHNVGADVNETHDLAGSKPQEVRRLAAQLSRWSGGMIAPKWPTKHPASYDVCGRTFKLPI